MPAVALQGGRSTGHGWFPPKGDIGGYSSKTSINGKKVQLTGVTGYGPIHRCGKVVHGMGKVVTGSRKTTMEGKPIARIGDKIACGDTVAKGSRDTFFS